MKLSALPVPAASFVAWRFTNSFSPPTHYGFDIGIDVGTPIMAAKSGEVLLVDADGDFNQGYGNYIVLWHDAARTSTGVWKATQFTLYAHLSAVNVKNGDPVTAGQQIGLSGNTGNSTGPHLHFQCQEVKYPVATRPAETSGTCIDPYPLLCNLEAETVTPPPVVIPPGPLIIPGKLKVKDSAKPYVNVRATPGGTIVGQVRPGSIVESVSVDANGWIKTVTTTYAYVKQDYFDNA